MGPAAFRPSLLRNIDRLQRDPPPTQTRKELESALWPLAPRALILRLLNGQFSGVTECVSGRWRPSVARRRLALPFHGRVPAHFRMGVWRGSPAAPRRRSVPQLLAVETEAAREPARARLALPGTAGIGRHEEDD